LIRYYNEKCGLRLSATKNYPKVAMRNHKLAAKQGNLLVRSLVLPNHLKCDALPIIRWLARNLKDKALVNVMSQYRPCFKAREYPETSRVLASKEYDEVYRLAKKLGLNLVNV